MVPASETSCALPCTSAASRFKSIPHTGSRTAPHSRMPPHAHLAEALPHVLNGRQRLYRSDARGGSVLGAAARQAAHLEGRPIGPLEVQPVLVVRLGVQQLQQTRRWGQRWRGGGRRMDVGEPEREQLALAVAPAT